MSRIRILSAFFAVLIPLTMGATAAADPGGNPNPNADFGQDHKKVCPDTGQPDVAQCHADLVTKADKVTPAQVRVVAGRVARAVIRVRPAACLIRRSR